MPLPPEFIQSLNKSIAGEVRVDRTTRLLYSTDASIYQIEPLGVCFPRQLDDLQTIVELAASYGVPILARGSGSSLAGQAIGAALVVDCSRYLYKQIVINPVERTATVEPGVIMNALNKSAALHGLQFGPDPASAERATMGGSLANNASGAHSNLYGMAADHLLSAEVILADGSMALLEEITLNEAQRRAVNGDKRSREAAFYRAALDIREHAAEAIRSHWPRTWRRASGYNLNYLLPWSQTEPAEWRSIMGDPAAAVDDERQGLSYPPIKNGCINLAPLIAGSEGTLAVIHRATVRLVARPKETVLGLLAFPSVVAACEAVPRLLETHPAAIELLPESLIRLARSVPAYAHSMGFLDHLISNRRDPAALLVVEFAGDQPQPLLDQARRLGRDVLIAANVEQQKQVWAMRKVGLGILQSQPGDIRPITFIEDISVPVEHLGEFVQEMERILAEHGTRGDFYAHASSGCLHMRPILNIKTNQGITTMRSIAKEAVELAFRLGGASSGEHGDGLSRSEWLEKAYGPEVMAAFRELKTAVDPQGMLNPGKILDAQPMDQNLRFRVWERAAGWQPSLDFSAQAGLVGAVELCNGAGVCRKAEGVMCPSFQATREEMHSTRGRANLLRALMLRAPGSLIGADDRLLTAIYEALDLCLACKGCRAECPSSVDMAKLRYEFLNEYYKSHRRRLRDYLFGYIGMFARVGYPFASLVNPILRWSPVKKAAGKILGLSDRRPLPRLSRVSFKRLVRTRPGKSVNINHRIPVIFLSDPFTEYFYPEAGLAVLRVLEACGCQVHILPVIGAGRTLISKGFLEAAKRHAYRVVEAIQRIDPLLEMPVVGVEPSEIYTLKDEYLDLMPGDHRVRKIAERAYMIDEFLLRPVRGGEPMLSISDFPDTPPSPGTNRVLLHGHCYQKTLPPAADGFPVGVEATRAMLEATGYQVILVESGCCGMAGAFGYEAEHYDLSLDVANLSLLSAVRAEAMNVVIAASGVSCQAQIEDGTGRHTLHPITLVARRLDRVEV